MSDFDDEPKKTLSDEDIEQEPRDIGRRNALGMAGVAAVSAVAFATGCGRRRVVRVQTGGPPVQVQYQQQGYTDNDGGPCADPAGGGRGNSGITDSDGGACADPAGRGRGGVRVQVQPQPQVYQTGITDNDGGPCADPAGGGRGYSGRTDSDSGTCSDPAGRGRY